MAVLVPLDQRFLESLHWAFNNHRRVGQQIRPASNSQVDAFLFPRLNIDSLDTQDLRALLTKFDLTSGFISTGKRGEKKTQANISIMKTS